MIRIKRVYDPPVSDDATRVLVERLWPRGVTKDAARRGGWAKDAAPSTALRRWFGHDPARWAEFQQRSAAELDSAPAAWAPLLMAARSGDVTLVYSARDIEHNSAVALQRYLLAHLATDSPVRPE